MKKDKREITSTVATNRITDGKSSWGIKEFNTGYSFRSQYEYAFAVYLDELNIKWEFEKHGEVVETITGTHLHYIPDFFLPEYSVYIEIVNNMNKRLANKMYWFTTQYHNLKLIVFDKKSLREMFASKFNIYDVIGYPKKSKGGKS